MTLKNISEDDKKNYTLYDFVKISCLRNNVTITDLSKSTGLAYKTIRTLKVKKPSMNTYVKIGKFFNIVAADLYELDIVKCEKEV